MKTISVDMELGEEVRMAPIAFQAIAGNWRRVLIPASLGMAIGLLVAPILGTLLQLLVLLTAAPGAATAFQAVHESFFVGLEIAAGIIGWKVGEIHGSKKIYERFFAGLRERGTPPTVPTRFSIETNGLRAKSERGSSFMAWPSIVEILVTETHWLLQWDSLTLALPRRAFRTVDQEREFLTQITEHLTNEARARSRPAFAETLSD